jgi:KDO2-lipid IV(A) lauroyltransferase
MNVYDVINSRVGLGLALGLGRTLPPSLGYRLANLIADRIASRRNSPIAKAVRANQWVVSGGTLSSEQLDRSVQEVFRHTAHSIYTLYHYLNNRSAFEAMVKFSSPVLEIIEQSRQGKQAMIVVGIHMSNFDLVARAGFQNGLRALAISFPNPGGGYRWQNKMRNEAGWEVIPASMTAIRRAAQHLSEGKVVITGIDRPIPDTKYRPRFFGRSAALPVHHIYLALLTKAPVRVVAAIQLSDGAYHILSSDAIFMQPHPDRRVEILRNAEMVLEIAADFIRQAPHQWAMFYPVWSEALNEMP